MHKGITVGDLLKLDNKAVLCDYIYGISSDSGLFDEDELKLLFDAQMSVINGKQDYTEYTIHFHSKEYHAQGCQIPCELLENLDDIITTCWECALLKFQNNRSTKHRPCNIVQTLKFFVEYFLDGQGKCVNCKCVDDTKTYHLCLLCFDCMCEDCFVVNGSNHEHRENTENTEFDQNMFNLSTRTHIGEYVAQKYNIVELLKNKTLFRKAFDGHDVIQVTYYETNEYGYVDHSECFHKKFIKKYFLSEISNKDKGHWWGKFKLNDLKKSLQIQ